MFSSIGTHQKFDRTAFELLTNKIDQEKFPSKALILQFEGFGGPDGLKLKGKYKSDHLWDPVNKIGQLPGWIETHYKNLVEALKAGDMEKAAFEAGFMAHYLTDGLTPAHHISHKYLLEEYEDSRYRRRWKIYGRKGLMSSHVAFETGVSSAIFFTPIDVRFDNTLLKQIKKDGIRRVIMNESLGISKHRMYEQFLRKGWNAKLAKSIKATVVKRIPQLISATWLAAYQEAYGEDIVA